MHIVNNLSFLPILALVDRTSARKISATQHVHVVASFASCPPPRFDNFLDSILGSWGSTRTTGTTSGTTSSNVEEVMRSCGGAVQGVTETVTGSIDEHVYHNRADDGFIFSDCGSYSAGPTFMNVPEHDASFVSNLSFPPTEGSSQKSRMLVIQNDAVFLKKKGFSSSNNEGTGNEGNESNNMDVESTSTLLDRPPSNILWEQEILCRMSSSTQPWMLQRASWGKFTNSIDEDNSNDSNDDNNDDPITKDKELCLPYTWMTSCTFPLEDPDSATSTPTKQFWQSKELSSLFRSNNISKVIQIGAMLDSNNIKAFLRCYDGEGNLKAVVTQNGTSL